MERRDQLEEFVQKQLSHYEEPPSDGLWGRIEGLIPPMPKRGTKPPWLWGLLGALLILGGIIVWHFYSVHQWKEKVEEQEMAIQQLWEELETLKSDVIIHATTAEQQASKVEALFENRTAEATETDPSLTSGSSHQDASSSALQQKETENTNVIEVKPLTPLVTNVLPNPVQAENELALPTMNWQLLEPIKEKRTLLVAEDSPQILEPIKIVPTRRYRWAIGAWMEGTNFHDNPLNALWKRARRSEDVSGDTPSFYANNPSSTNTVGFFLDFDLNRRWSIRTGLGYKDQRRPLGGDFVFAYTLEDSQMNALGHSASPYSYYDESHNISIRTIIANELSNEPNGLEPGELFEMDFAAYQQTSYVSFPLWLSYQMGHGRLKYHMRTGLVWNDLISNSSKIRYLSFSFSQLYYQGHAINDGTIQVGYLDVGLGYGLEYALSPKLGLYFDGVMYKSVTPIFDRQPFSLGMGGGLNYQF